MAVRRHAVVEEGRMAVRLGVALYPFRLSARAGGAVIDLGDGERRVRPLTWGERVWLARFAGLGPAVLTDAMLELAADEASPAALSDKARAVLVALAIWIDRAGRQGTRDSGLPLDPEALAAAALAVHRATGWPPGALDAMPASEVEALARAAQGPEPAEGEDETPGQWPAEAAPGMTRINVLPDPPAPRSAGTPMAAPERLAASEAAARSAGQTRPRPKLNARPATDDTQGGAAAPSRPQRSRFRLVRSGTVLEDRSGPAGASDALGSTAPRDGAEAKLLSERPGARSMPAAEPNASAGGDKIDIGRKAGAPASLRASLPARVVAPAASSAASRTGPAARGSAASALAARKRPEAVSPQLAGAAGSAATGLLAPVGGATLAAAQPSPPRRANSPARLSITPAYSDLGRAIDSRATDIDALADAVTDRIEARLRETALDLGVDLEA